MFKYFTDDTYTIYLYLYNKLTIKKNNMINKNLPHTQTKTGLQITFCGKGSCKCPGIDINKDNDTIIIGGNEEGYTRFTKEQFEMFLLEAKNGTFDDYLQTLKDGL